MKLRALPELLRNHEMRSGIETREQFPQKVRPLPGGKQHVIGRDLSAFSATSVFSA